MLEKLLARLNLAGPPADAQHAHGALLARAGKADMTYLFSEIHESEDPLAALYALNPVKAAQLRAQCEKLEAAMPDTGALAHILQPGISEADKAAVVRALWAVARADGVHHKSERQVVALARDALGMAPDRAAALRGPDCAAWRRGIGLGARAAYI
jgi:uncharacterized tellurite resistance protein B-like protein